MKYLINPEEINTVILFIKYIFINIGAYSIFLKLSNNLKFNIKNIIIIFYIMFATLAYINFQKYFTPINSKILLIICLVCIFAYTSNSCMGYTVVMTIFSLCISYTLFFISTFINSIPNIVFNVQSDVIISIGIDIVYILLLYIFMKNKRLKNGMTFINKNSQNELFDILMLNISTIILFSIEIFGNYNVIMLKGTVTCIVILSIIMFITIKKSFQVYYKQKLLMKQLEESNNEILSKQKEIEKLEQENLEFSKRSHSLAHKQKSLEYKLNQLLMNEETAEELEIKDRLKEISTELYKNPIEELTKTGITQIDDMLKYMQSECVKNNIDFNLQVSGNIYHLINNIISTEQLEILIADHVKDAIIAINHTDNVNRSILVRLGKIEDTYGLYIYDSGIEFEKETLENLGKKPSTTHKNEGGTGMGFMNTFDTLEKCNGSLIINELGKPSKENYTKIVMIKFDNKNEFKIISYK